MYPGTARGRIEPEAEALDESDHGAGPEGPRRMSPPAKSQADRHHPNRPLPGIAPGQGTTREGDDNPGHGRPGHQEFVISNREDAGTGEINDRQRGGDPPVVRDQAAKGPVSRRAAEEKS